MKIFKTIIALWSLAFVNAAYLSAKALGILWWSTFCDINSRRSCANVVNHPAAYIGPVPFPVIALIVYPVLIILAAVWMRSKNSKKYYKTLAILSALGMMFNGYIIYQETFIIKAFCPLCLLCTAIIISIFILSLISYKRVAKK